LQAEVAISCGLTIKHRQNAHLAAKVMSGGVGYARSQQQVRGYAAMEFGRNDREPGRWAENESDVCCYGDTSAARRIITKMPSSAFGYTVARVQFGGCVPEQWML
jgi:hypothetical protein